MQDFDIWFIRATWGLAVFDWLLCLFWARYIALQKGYSRLKSWLLGLLGPIGLLWAWRFPPDIREPQPIQPGRPGRDLPGESDYKAHPRFRELKDLLRGDEGAAIRLIGLERGRKPLGSLSLWIDNAIFRLLHDRDAHLKERS